jgi:transposase InsO family protein
MGVRPSMGTVGDAYDNAMAESFFDTLDVNSLTYGFGRRTPRRAQLFLPRLKPSTSRTSVIQVWGRYHPLTLKSKRSNERSRKHTKPVARVDNSAPVQTEFSIDCEPQVFFIENTQKVKDL